MRREGEEELLPEFKPCFPHTQPPFPLLLYKAAYPLLDSTLSAVSWANRTKEIVCRIGRRALGPGLVTNN